MSTRLLTSFNEHVNLSRIPLQMKLWTSQNINDSVIWNDFVSIESNNESLNNGFKSIIYILRNAYKYFF